MEQNKGGRPPIYESTEENHAEVKGLCDSFFEYIKGESKALPKKDPEDEDEPLRFEIIRNPEPPTVTGLTLHLGFESKNTLYDYAKKDGFSDSIKRALTRIEQYHEIAVSMGDKCTGNIFVLKNFNWHDTIQTEHSGYIADRPKIEFVRKTEE